MQKLVEFLISGMKSDDPNLVQESLLRISFFFEKSRGIGIGKSRQEQIDSFGWTEDVVNEVIVIDDVERLKSEIITFIQNTFNSPNIGSALWALGNLMDRSNKNIFIEAMINLLDKDPGGLYQAMIALDNIGEKPFGKKRSLSNLDAEDNQRLAKEYLEKEGYI